MSHGYVFVHLFYIGRDDWYNVRCVYTYRREASRCSFRRTGNARAFRMWSEQQVTGFTLFLYSKQNYDLPFEADGKRLNNETYEKFLSEEWPPHDGHGYDLCFM